VRFDLFAQANMLQQRAESTHLGPSHRISNFFSQAFLFVGSDVAAVEFIEPDTERFSPSLEMNAARVIPEGRGFLKP
jgi:hypothetical protein